MQCVFKEISAEQASKRVRCAPAVSDLPLLHGGATIQIASEEVISTLDDLFPITPTQLGKPVRILGYDSI